MNNSSLGPKLLLQIKLHIGQSDDLIPDDPFLQFNGQQEWEESKQRYDTQGRQIVRGKKYSIEFDNCVTICVYSPKEEVLQIKETLSQISNDELTKVNFKSPQSFNKSQQYTAIPTKSILKKNNQLNVIKQK